MNFDELFLRIIFGAIICISYLCHKNSLYMNMVFKISLLLILAGTKIFVFKNSYINLHKPFLFFYCQNYTMLKI